MHCCVIMLNKNVLRIFSMRIKHTLLAAKLTRKRSELLYLLNDPRTEIHPYNGPENQLYRQSSSPYSSFLIDRSFFFFSSPVWTFVEANVIHSKEALKFKVLIWKVSCELTAVVNSSSKLYFAHSQQGFLRALHLPLFPFSLSPFVFWNKFKKPPSSLNFICINCFLLSLLPCITAFICSLMMD